MQVSIVNDDYDNHLLCQFCFSIAYSMIVHRETVLYSRSLNVMLWQVYLCQQVHSANRVTGQLAPLALPTCICQLAPFPKFTLSPHCQKI